MIRKNDRRLSYLSLFFFFSCIASVFHNIQRVLHWMAMMTSVLTSLRNITYQMAYGNAMFLRRHIILYGYSYFPYTRHYLILVVTATFILTLYLPIFDIMIPRFLSLMTISMYDSFLSYILFFLCSGLGLVHIYNLLLG